MSDIQNMFEASIAPHATDLDLDFRRKTNTTGYVDATTNNTFTVWLIGYNSGCKSVLGVRW